MELGHSQLDLCTHLPCLRRSSFGEKPNQTVRLVLLGKVSCLKCTGESAFQADGHWQADTQQVR